MLPPPVQPALVCGRKRPDRQADQGYRLAQRCARHLLRRGYIRRRQDPCSGRTRGVAQPVGAERESDAERRPPHHYRSAAARQLGCQGRLPLHRLGGRKQRHHPKPDAGRPGRAGQPDGRTHRHLHRGRRNPCPYGYKSRGLPRKRARGGCLVRRFHRHGAKLHRQAQQKPHGNCACGGIADL